MIAIRPPSRLPQGSARTLPPAFTALAATASASSTHTYVAHAGGIPARGGEPSAATSLHTSRPDQLWRRRRLPPGSTVPATCNCRDAPGHPGPKPLAPCVRLGTSTSGLAGAVLTSALREPKLFPRVTRHACIGTSPGCVGALLLSQSGRSAIRSGRKRRRTVA